MHPAFLVRRSLERLAFTRVTPPHIRPEPLPSIVIDRFLQQGRIWSGFGATCPGFNYPAANKSASSISSGSSSEHSERVLRGHNHSNCTARLVAKFTSPTEHYGREGVCPEAAREAWLYTHNLRCLQGKVVPRWWGVYYAEQSAGRGTRRAEVLCAIMEDAGRPLDEVEAGHLDKADK